MGPEAEPYRPSWLPFGRARLAAASRGMTAAASATPVRRRIPMAPVQLGRVADEPSARGPEALSAPAMPLEPAMPSAPAMPLPSAQPRPPRPPSPPRPPRPPQRRSPQVPAAARPATAPVTVRMPAPEPVVRTADRVTSRRRPGTPPFDGLAIAAIVLAFIVAPFALVLAIASVRRAYAKGVSPLLSWLALLLAGFTTLVTTGLWSVVIGVLGGIGG